MTEPGNSDGAVDAERAGDGSGARDGSRVSGHGSRVSGQGGRDGQTAEAQPGLLLRVVKDQKFAFLLVGGFNTGFGFVLFILFDLTVGAWLDRAVNETIGSLATLFCAHVIGVLIAFVLYRRFVFRVRGHVWRDLARFESVYLVSIGINAVILPILVNLGWNRILAQLCILVITVGISWFGHKGFSFRRSEES